MSMSNEAFSALQEYNKFKDQVQATLDAMNSETELAALIGGSTKLALAINALQVSVKYRKKYAKSEGSDSGHAARLKREEEALALLNKAAYDKNAKSLKAAQDAANEEKKQQMKVKSLKDEGAFPTLGEAMAMQPNKKVYVPPPKKPFQWGPPSGGNPPK